MKRTVLGLLPIVLWASVGWTFDEPPQKPKTEAAKTPAEQVIALQQEFQNELTAFTKLLQEAKTDAEREKVLEKQPSSEKFAARFLEIAEKSPNDPAAITALLWVVTYEPAGAQGKKAYELLSKNHAGSPNVVEIVKRLALMGVGEAKPFLRAVIEKNDSHEAKGIATYGLAQLAKEQSENAEGEAVAKATKEAETLLQEVIDHYGDIKPFNESLGTLAKADLYHIRHFGIGKLAPDIEGDDLDGKALKLSEYKGKVVVLDFWGNW